MTDKFLLADLETYFITYASDVASADGTDIFLDDLPQSPDNCVGLFEYEGVPDFISDVGNRSIQVMVRNADYQTARRNIWKLFDLLYKPESDVRIIDFTASRFGIVKARSMPHKLRRDESGREIFIFTMGIVTQRDQ